MKTKNYKTIIRPKYKNLEFIKYNATTGMEGHREN